MMIGGRKDAVDMFDPIFSALAPGIGGIPRTPDRAAGDPRAERGYIDAGPSGAGYFVKMVHNGIEYGMMQAYTEGFDILRNKNSEDLPENERFTLNMPDKSQQRLDILLDVLRLGGRSISLDHLAVLADQKLGEVPAVSIVQISPKVDHVAELPRRLQWPE